MSRSHRRSRSGCSRHSAKTERLGQVLAAPGVTVIHDGTDLLRVSGITAEQIGTAAWRAHLPAYVLTPTGRPRRRKAP